MQVFDREQSIATDVGEYWDVEAEAGTPVIVNMAISDDIASVDFSFGPFKYSEDKVNLVIPIDRLRKLLREAKPTF